MPPSISIIKKRVGKKNNNKTSQEKLFQNNYSFIDAFTLIHMRIIIVGGSFMAAPPIGSTRWRLDVVSVSAAARPGAARPGGGAGGGRTGGCSRRRQMAEPSANRCESGVSQRRRWSGRPDELVGFFCWLDLSDFCWFKKIYIYIFSGQFETGEAIDWWNWWNWWNWARSGLVTA